MKCAACGLDLYGIVTDCPECGLHYSVPSLRAAWLDGFRSESVHCPYPDKRTPQGYITFARARINAFGAGYRFKQQCAVRGDLADVQARLADLEPIRRRHRTGKSKA